MRKAVDDLGAPENTLDLRGVPCPLNWARAKSRLEVMRPGERLRLWVDDPRAERDIPPAAEAEGWVVVACVPLQAGVAIDIER
jgi:TusA-related sulfurtransferase